MKDSKTYLRLLTQDLEGKHSPVEPPHANAVEGSLFAVSRHHPQDAPNGQAKRVKY